MFIDAISNLVSREISLIMEIIFEFNNGNYFSLIMEIIFEKIISIIFSKTYNYFKK